MWHNLTLEGCVWVFRGGSLTEGSPFFKSKENGCQRRVTPPLSPHAESPLQARSRAHLIHEQPVHRAEGPNPISKLIHINKHLRESKLSWCPELTVCYELPESIRAITIALLEEPSESCGEVFRVHIEKESRFRSGPKREHFSSFLETRSFVVSLISGILRLHSRLSPLSTLFWHIGIASATCKLTHIHCTDVE